MTSNRKIAANRLNSRKSCGPRTAAGKSVAGRNALRHGLAAITHRQSAPPAEIAEFARALCGDDTDPSLFARAVKIAENEVAIRTIRAQQVAVIERLREPYIVPFAKRDNSFELAKGRFMEGWLAEREIDALLPKVLEKYRIQILALIERNESEFLQSQKSFLEWLTLDGCIAVNDIIPFVLESLLHEFSPIDNETLELARKKIDERDEHEALKAAVLDLIRLDRYQRRTWSRQKRAIRQFIALRFDRDSRSSAA